MWYKLLWPTLNPNDMALSCQGYNSFLGQKFAKIVSLKKYPLTPICLKVVRGECFWVFLVPGYPHVFLTWDVLRPVASPLTSSLAESCFDLLSAALLDDCVRCQWDMEVVFVEMLQVMGTLCVPLPWSPMVTGGGFNFSWKGNKVYSRSVSFEKWEVKMLTPVVLAGSWGLVQIMGCGNVLLLH